jgi:hypothetical protein
VGKTTKPKSAEHNEQQQQPPPNNNNQEHKQHGQQDELDEGGHTEKKRRCGARGQHQPKRLGRRGGQEPSRRSSDLLRSRSKGRQERQGIADNMERRSTVGNVQQPQGHGCFSSGARPEEEAYRTSAPGCATQGQACSRELAPGYASVRELLMFVVMWLSEKTLEKAKCTKALPALPACPSCCKRAVASNRKFDSSASRRGFRGGLLAFFSQSFRKYFGSHLRK